MLNRIRREPVLAAAGVIVVALMGLDLSEEQMAGVVSVIAFIVRHHVTPAAKDDE